MQTYLKISAAALCAALAALTLRKSSPDVAMLLGIVGCVIGAIAVIELIQPVIEFVQALYQKTGLDQDLLAPLLKSAGVGLLTQISGSVCADAGQSALARVIELGGAALCLYLALPLLSAVVSLLGQLAGGG